MILRPLIVCAVIGFFLGNARADDRDRILKGEVLTELIEVPGSDFKRGKVQGTLDASVDDVWKVLIDYNHFTEFIPDVVESVIREQSGDQLKYFSRLDMPWPISNIEYMAEVIFDPDHRGLSFHLVPGTGKGLKEFNGTWKLESVRETPPLTLATYQIYLEPDRWYPKWAVRMGMKRTLGQLIGAMRKRLKEPSLHKRRNDGRE